MMHWLLARVLAGGIAGCLMALLLLGILWLAPPPVPKLQAEIPYHAKHQDGIVEKHDLFGLLQAQWVYVDGRPHGPALHHYPNRSVFRELQYVEGKLDGVMREYYQEERMRGGGRRGAFRDARQMYEASRGPLKGEWRYMEGVRDGDYTLYYENEYIKEEGQYRNDKYFGRILKYSKDGQLISERYFQNGAVRQE